MAVKSTYHKKSSKGKKKKNESASPLLNGIIVGLMVVIIIFLYSIIQKQTLTPAETDLTATSLDNIPTAVLSYQEKLKETMNVRVEILNGCGVSGLAARTKVLLTREGVDVISTGNAPHQNYEKTLIYIHGDNFNKAEKIKKLLGITTDPLIDGYTPDIPCDLTIILGHDYTELSIY
ncbi:MAG: LytR C-terminal domain-containing protein [Candidatus Marinimicrobia bacterium]|nr:LytR C-terminal domain-containing protein [Candidatus Neomarinimicrobiota bacterium]MDD5581607.1 LytR C-terminal domain-containing protein [Candidatus Neomarinimicrobiota bacterium]